MALYEEAFNTIIEKKIVKNEDALSDAWRPRDKIKFRDEEAATIIVGLRSLIEKEKESPGPHIVITGYTGAGKTLVVKAIVESAEVTAKKRGVNLRLAYVNCANPQVISIFRLYDAMLRCWGVDAKTGWTQKMLVEQFEKTPGNKLIVLDEADKLIDRIGDEFLHSLTRQKGVALMLVSNRVDFERMIEDVGVESSLRGPHVFFGAYNAEQIREIIAERMLEAFYTNLPTDVVNYTAAKAAARNGDVRYAFRLLLLASRYAEVEGRDVSVEYVQRADTIIHHEEAEGVLGKVPLHGQLIFQAIAECHPQTSKSAIIERYKQLAGGLALSERRCHEVLRDLDSVGLIQMLGRPGIGSTIRLRDMDPETAKSVISRALAKRWSGPILTRS